MIGGFAGAGKTSLGQEIARLVEFAFFDKDTLTAPLVECLLEAIGNPGGIHDRESDIYVKQVRPSEYASFMNAVMECVQLGISVVAVAPFLREISDPGWRAALETECSRQQVRVHYVWVFARDETLRRRLIRRGSHRDLAKLENWDQHAARMQAIQAPQQCLLWESSDGTLARDQALKLARHLGLIT